MQKNSLSGLTNETPDILVIQQVMHDMQFSSFNGFHYVNLVIDECEKRTGNWRRIFESKRDVFRMYRCSAHVNCPFRIHFVARPSDGKVYLKHGQNPSKINHHTSVSDCAPRASDGRLFKNRHQGRFDGDIDQVLQTKHAPPAVPGEIIKTAATKKNEILTYTTAWRQWNGEVLQMRESCVKNFQLVIGLYLRIMADFNPSSVMGHSNKRETNEIVDFHFFPGFIYDDMNYV